MRGVIFKKYQEKTKGANIVSAHRKWWNASEWAGLQMGDVKYNFRPFSLNEIIPI